MALVIKGRRTRFDNIAVGSAITTHERTILGSAPSTVNDVVGNIENIAVGSDYGEERVIAGSVLPEQDDIAN